MRRRRMWPLALAAALAVASSHSASAQDTTVFVNVHVVPMTSPVVLRHRTVVVAAGTIVAIDSGATRSYGGARTIDGAGGYLVPGLADAHVHLELDERRWMPVFLSHGVTTVFNLRGDARHITLRTEVAEGRAPGPTIYTSGAYANLPGIQTADDASRVVAEQHSAGYDFVKIHGGLSPDAFRAMTTDGRRAGIPIIGHAPRNLPFDTLLANRQTMVAHVEEILYTHFREADTAGLGALAPRMREAGVWLTPNLIAYALITRQIGRMATIDSMLAFPDARVLDSTIVRYWRSGVYTNRPLASAPAYDRNRRFLTVVTKALHDAGIPMLAGTDAPLPGLYPGHSLHDELDLLVDAGFSRYDALATATTNAGRFVREAVRPGVQFGTITPGMRADLVLVDGNPFDDLNVLRRPRGTMAAGRWYDRAALDRYLTGRSEAAQPR